MTYGDKYNLTLDNFSLSSQQLVLNYIYMRPEAQEKETMAWKENLGPFSSNVELHMCRT